MAIDSLLAADLRTKRQRVLDSLALGDESAEAERAVEGLMVELGLAGADPDDVVDLASEAIDAVILAVDAVAALRLSELGADDEWVTGLLDSLREAMAGEIDRDAAAVLVSWLQAVL